MRSLLFNFFNILLFALFSSVITAQPSEDGPTTDLGTVTNDGDAQPNIYKFCLDDNNQLVIKINVTLDNLEIMGSAPNQYGVIPTGVHNMNVEFTVNGQTSIVPVGNFDLVTLENGTNAFNAVIESEPFDFASECDNTEEDFVDVVIQYRLVTLQGDDTYATYPACLYQYSLFTCNVYPNAPWCDAVPNNGFGVPGDDQPPVAECYDSWFSGGYAAWLYCDCEDETPVPPKQDDKVIDGGNDYFNGGDDINNRFNLENKINVYPNPVGELMHIESNNESIRQIEIYNSRGELVLNNVYKMPKNQNVSLNTSDYAKGLYLVKIATDSGIEIMKVLK